MFNLLYFSKNYNENSFFLDTYSGASGAWSMRSMKVSTLSSAVYRVRRTVTAGTADVFLDVNGLISLDSPITIVTGTSLATNLGQYVAGSGYSNVDSLGSAASAFCSIWYDTSGNGKNAIQNTDAYQPRLVNLGILDKDPYTNRTSLFFNGSNLFSIASFDTNLSVLNSHSVFTVHKNLSSAPNSVFRSSISATNRFAINYFISSLIMLFLIPATEATAAIKGLLLVIADTMWSFSPVMSGFMSISVFSISFWIFEFSFSVSVSSKSGLLRFALFSKVGGAS